MARLIVEEPLTDNSVYGVRQMQYTVNGKSGQNFIDAVAMASFRQAVAIEDTTSSYTAVVRARQVKIDELAEALSYVAKAVGSLDHDAKSSTKTKIDNASRVREIANRYGGQRHPAGHRHAAVVHHQARQCVFERCQGHHESKPCCKLDNRQYRKLKVERGGPAAVPAKERLNVKEDLCQR